MSVDRLHGDMGIGRYDSERLLGISKTLVPVGILLVLSRNLVRYRVSDQARWPEVLMLVGGALLLAACAIRLRYDEWLGRPARVALIVAGTVILALVVVSVLVLAGVIAPF